VGTFCCDDMLLKYLFSSIFIYKKQVWTKAVYEMEMCCGCDISSEVNDQSTHYHINQMMNNMSSYR